MKEIKTSKQSRIKLLVCIIVLSIIVMPITKASGSTKKVRLSKSKIEIYEGSQFRLKLNNLSSKKKISWSSSSKKIATVDNSGLISAKNIGCAKINANVSGKNYTCKVKVKLLQTSNKSARKAFKRMLSDTSIFDGWWSVQRKLDELQFISLDMGEKKVPVLVVWHNGASQMDGYVRVYQYINGKVTLVNHCDGVEVYPEAAIINLGYLNHGIERNMNIKFEYTSKEPRVISEIKEACDDYTREIYGDDFYKVNGKEVTKSEFKKWQNNKLAISSIILYSSAKINTDANRKKYLN